LDDVAEVSSYVAALEHGVARLKGGFPLSNRLIREIHAKLLPRGRGSEKAPGEFRRSQNWIGGTRPGNAHFVPPPPAEVEDCMAALERFIHDERTPYPALVKAGLAHVQFETIHPFLDGNGRIGRLLIALLLHDSGVSAAFRTTRSTRRSAAAPRSSVSRSSNAGLGRWSRRIATSTWLPGRAVPEAHDPKR
jgi:Fic family protein